MHFEPHKFPGLHKDIFLFAKTGRFVAGSTICVEAFMALSEFTALGHKHLQKNRNSSGKLYVTLEFTRTVAMPRPNDQYQVSATATTKRS